MHERFRDDPCHGSEAVRTPLDRSDDLRSDEVADRAVRLLCTDPLQPHAERVGLLLQHHELCDGGRVEAPEVEGDARTGGDVGTRPRSTPVRFAFLDDQLAERPATQRSALVRRQRGRQRQVAEAASRRGERLLRDHPVGPPLLVDRWSTDRDVTAHAFGGECREINMSLGRDEFVAELVAERTGEPLQRPELDGVGGLCAFDLGDARRRDTGRRGRRRDVQSSLLARMTEQATVLRWERDRDHDEVLTSIPEVKTSVRCDPRQWVADAQPRTRSAGD